MLVKKRTYPQLLDEVGDLLLLSTIKDGCSLPILSLLELLPIWFSFSFIECLVLVRVI